MKFKGLTIVLLVLVSFVACKKESVPTQDEYYYSFKVKISNKIKEPTIINGYHGYVLLYEGDFMPSTEEEVQAPDTVRNDLYFYEESFLSELQSVTFEKDGTTFYDLKALEDKDIEPKFIVKPNKHGFYQIDTNDDLYLVLIKTSKNTGYYNGGALQIGGDDLRLRNLNMRIDYDATF